MASHCEISIVIPVFNEAQNLAEVLAKIRALELAQAEIIVVDDGSSDGTADIALNAGANVIRHPYNIGNGAAVKSGMRAARGRLILLMDG
ncbi:MAG TPA: glycosyltransferase family 2 protein, partial [Verrucomicrobiae bacterium]|nr:glycosyltransferase family 2 protein [Verrucomicrobiae bacterium]